MRKLFLVLALSFLSACATGQGDANLNAAPQAANPQPDAASLKDGLATDYYATAFDHVNDLESWITYRDPNVGTPIVGLEHRAGKGDVLTSGSSDLVGVVIKGYLRMPEAGSYQLQVTTNDGVRIHLGGARIHDDPKVGPERTLESAPFQISEPGWYPLSIWYFEKRGSAVLEVLWKTPQSGGFTSIPAEDLKH